MAEEVPKRYSGVAVANGDGGDGDDGGNGYRMNERCFGGTTRAEKIEQTKTMKSCITGLNHTCVRARHIHLTL